MTNTDWTGTPTPYAPGLTGAVIIPGDEPVKDILLAFRGTWLTEFHPDSDDAEWRKWVPVGTDVGPITEHLTVRWPELRFTAGRHPYRAVFAASNHLWMFRGDRYLKLDLKTGKLATAPDADPATEIAIDDKDFVHGITAATAISDTEVYLFNNLDYYKYNLDTGHYSARMTLDVKDKLVWVTTQRLDTVCFDARNSSTSSLRLLYFVEACDGELKTEKGGEELKVGAARRQPGRPRPRDRRPPARRRGRHRPRAHPHPRRRPRPPGGRISLNHRRPQSA
ncbi:hypothetical protein ACFCXR_23860, partial [Streptomyces noursei]|uniref:hypothetical protein n=1 Tax=Streptomyces noursei TaxID=1971 RepID=UPI0035D8EBB9